MVVLSDEICIGYREESSAHGFAGDPYYINRERFKDCHTHIRGGTGHGKSSFLANLVYQLCRPYDVWQFDGEGSRRVVESGAEDPIFVIICGQDLSLFHQVRLAAEQNGRTFRYFSLEPGRSHFIDPFQFQSESPIASMEIASLMMQAFNLDSGLGHGNLFYTSANLDAIFRVVQHVFRKRQAGEHITLADVARHLERNNNRDQQHIKMMVNFLLPFTQLQPSPEEPNKIDFCRAIRDKEVICGLFPPLTMAGPACQLAGLMAYGIIHAAHLLGGAYGKPILIIDEVQVIAGRSYGHLLEHARKLIPIVMAHQNTSQLKSNDMDLTEVVEANTDIKVQLTFADKEVDQVLEHSRESRGVLDGQVIDGQNRLSHSQREFVGRALNRNTVLEIGAQRMKGFVIDRTCGAHMDPTPIRLEHPITPELYAQLKSKKPPLVKALEKNLHTSSTNGQRKRGATGSRPTDTKPPLVLQKSLGEVIKQQQIVS